MHVTNMTRNQPCMASTVALGCLATVLLWAAPAAVNPAAASAGLELIAEEMVAYVDANGIYTIAGNVKNHHEWAATPKLVITVRDAHAAHAVDIPYNAIPAKGELPFKAKVPDALHDAIIESYDLSASPASWIPHAPPVLAVMYDHTLIVHAQNGSMSGVAVNSGNTTLHDPVLWAVVHGKDGRILDVARTAPLGTIEPGQTVQFEMHPDPSVSGVSYYSCFAPSSNSVVPLSAKRGDQAYDMRYESGAWLYGPVFSEDGTGVTMQTTNSFPFETYANLEIPAVTRAEAFDVFVNGEPVEHQQSIDEMGMWHVSFEVRAQSQDVVEIRGFEQGDVLPALIPDYTRQGLLAWAVGDAGDAAAFDAILLLADRGLLPDVASGEPRIPGWLKTVVVWWVGDASIGDDVAMAAISYAIESGLVEAG